jgi:hypothetical protein
MAKTEHQGLQIALILFVMVSVVLAITTFVYYRQSEESAKAMEDAKKKMDAATTRANDFQARVDYVLHILGTAPLPEAQVDQLKQSFGSDEQMKRVIADFETFINSFGAGMPKDKQNYSAVAPEVLTAVRGANNSLLQQTEETAKLAKDSEMTRTKEAERTDTAIKAQQDAEKKLAEEKAKYEADRTDLQTKQSMQLANYQSELKKKDGDLDTERKKGDDLNKTIRVHQATINDQKKTITEMRDEPFEVPDGQITWVNQGANTVWINLGLADGLRRQTLFSVYDQADNGVTRTAKKASVEVTRVLDQHLAEARIIEDSPANPIMKDDLIFSPAWRPGKRVRFALAGFLDIDGDRRSDRNLVRSLLVASGGHIDAEMHDDGTIEPPDGMTSSTRYLVLGTRPDERTEQKILISYTAMQKKAEELGVEVINVDELLDWVGYRPELQARTVGLGKNADPRQFAPKPPEGKSPTSSGAVSEKFRERKPGDKYKAGSAFDK